MYLANSSLCCHFIDDVLKLGEMNQCSSIEWDMNYIPPTLDSTRVKDIKEQIKLNKLHMRFHLPYSYFDIAHKDIEVRQYSILLFQKYLYFIRDIGGESAVIHVGQNDPCSRTVAIHNLATIAEIAADLGIKICVENLTTGLTTQISFMKDILRLNNVYLCLDTGHAEAVENEDFDYLSFLYEVMDKCIHAHLYRFISKRNHMPFTSIEQLSHSKYVNYLISSKCNWFTMEVEKQIDQNKQIELVRRYLMVHKVN